PWREGPDEERSSGWIAVGGAGRGGFGGRDSWDGERGGQGAARGGRDQARLLGDDRLRPDGSVRGVQRQDRGHRRVHGLARLQEGEPFAQSHRLREADSVRPGRQGRGGQAFPGEEVMAEDSAPAPRGKERDAWDKAEIILKPIGGLLTAVAVALLGF